MTNDEIDAIRARLEAATPGPWYAHATNVFAAHNRSVAVTGGYASNGGDEERVYGDNLANAAFIGGAWADIRALLEEAARRRSALEDERRPWLNEA